MGMGAEKTRAYDLFTSGFQTILKILCMDVFGLLSMCDKSRNRFILMDLATHYPLAFPLRTLQIKSLEHSLVSLQCLDFPMKYFHMVILNSCRI